MGNRCKETGRFLPVEIKIGEKHFLWTILRFSHYGDRRYKFFECVCECGVVKTVCGARILRGESKSCGCYRFRKGQNQTHGLKKHPLYSVWNGIKQRCLNPNSIHWPDYGGRGIKICDNWKESVVNFYNDMHEGYKKGLHIGRIDNNGDYCKENCRWETPMVNSNNKRTNVYITFDGRTHTPTEWAREFFIKANTIQNRIRKGKKDYEALFGDDFSKYRKFDD